MVKTLKYIGKRILFMIPILIGVSLIIFLLSNLIPGSPIDAFIDENTTPADIERLTVKFGLDQPLPVRYWNWLLASAQGDFGNSFRSGQSVASMISNRIGPTLLLAFSALGLSLVISIVLGVLAACKPYSIIDYISSGMAFLGSGMPAFFLGLLSIYVFSVKLGILPNSGMYTSASSANFKDVALHMIQPTLVLAITLSGGNIRQTRSAMLEVMGEDYILVAKAKGMHRWTVILGHAFRNALIPIITSFGLTITSLVGGAIVSEQIFGWPGMGSLLMTSIKFRDYPAIMGITLYITVGIMLVNLVVDIIYGLVDPRVRV